MAERKQGFTNNGQENFDLVLSQKLPNDVVEHILLWVPVDNVCGYRTVCKDWNILFSSAKFLNLWNGMLQNRCSWLLFLNNKSCIMYYCFSTVAWRKMSTSSCFRSKRTAYYNSCKGSSAGLLLLDSKTFSYVCNPLTRTSLQLPQCLSMKTARNKGIVGGKEWYTVVASNCNAKKIEMYSSSEKEWKIVGQLNRFCHDMAFSDNGDGCFLIFCLIYRPPAGVMIYSFQSCMKTVSEAFVALPVIDTCLPLHARLALCSSSTLLLTTAVLEDDALFKNIIVWKLQRNDASLSESSWQEIGRMPPSVSDVFNRTSLTRADCSMYYETVGIGDYIYFNRDGSREVTAFNLMYGLWNFLPTCPTDVYPINTHSCNMISFEPRLANQNHQAMAREIED